MRPLMIKGAKVIMEGLAKGNVYVHCQYGISRSTTLIIAYFMIHLKQKMDKSLNFVRERRIDIYPHFNLEKALKSLESELKDFK